MRVARIAVAARSVMAGGLELQQAAGAQISACSSLDPLDLQRLQALLQVCLRIAAQRWWWILRQLQVCTL